MMNDKGKEDFFCIQNGHIIVLVSFVDLHENQNACPTQQKPLLIQRVECILYEKLKRENLKANEKIRFLFPFPVHQPAV